MAPLLSKTLLLASTLFTISTAQLLTNGNSQLPSCATSCPLLIQAAQACSGTTTASQQTWSCFCQSAYLSTLYSTPSGICDSVCTNPTDNQQVMTWYTTNCGKDLGASEHANANTGGATTVVITSTSTSAAATVAASTSATNNLPTSTSAAGNSTDSDPQPTTGSWWSNHYKWIIMLIVLFVGLLLFALVFSLLKRRHDRKRDQIRTGFNAGITTRSAPAAVRPSDAAEMSQSHVMAGGIAAADGRESPARTRDSFMPYGYNYTRSESRLSRQNLDARSSPLPGGMVRGGTPVGDLEKDVGIARADAITPASGKRQKKVLVRERGLQGPEEEKLG